MNKIWLIIQREYLTRVKKKSFLLTTILVPLVIIGFYAAIIAVMVSDNGDKEKIAVIDEGNLFEGKIPPEKDNKTSSVSYVFISEPKETFQKKYDEQGYAGYLYIPKLDIKSPQGIELHSKSTIGITTKSRIERTLDKAIEQKRLVEENIDPKRYESIKSNVEVVSQIDSETGVKKSVEGVAHAIALAAGILIYMVLLIYGSMVMRGVMEEKTNRISEVIVSSVKPFQLMFGKIVGIGAVGLTQFTIWIILIGILSSVMPLFIPEMAGQVTTQMSQSGIPQVVQKENILTTINEGMQSIDGALADLVHKGIITPDEAYLKAFDKKPFELLVKQQQQAAY